VHEHTPTTVLPPPAQPAGAWRIRPAGVPDIVALVALRRFMFEAMGHQDQAALDRMAEASTRYMEQALPAGDFRAWVAEAGPEGPVIAGGGLVIHCMPPTMRNLAGRAGYIMNLVTLPAWQRRGIATAILRTILDALRAEGVPAASLHASAAGRPLYEREGFEASKEMRLMLGGPARS